MNLNIHHAAMTVRSTHHLVTVSEPVEVIFADIASHLCSLLASTPYAVGCIAWLTDARILYALSKCQGVGLVVTNDTKLNNVLLRGSYNMLTPLNSGEAAVRCIGLRSGPSRSLMHHKFFVGLDTERVPSWVVMGSYNASFQASNNLEAICVFRSPAIARVFYDEYCVLNASAKPLRKIPTKALARLY